MDQDFPPLLDAIVAVRVLPTLLKEIVAWQSRATFPGTHVRLATPHGLFFSLTCTCPGNVEFAHEDPPLVV
jgi:hypothetical protein